MNSPAMQRDKKCSTTDNAPGGFVRRSLLAAPGGLSPKGCAPLEPPKGTVLRQVRCRWSIPLLATPAMRPDRGLASWLEWPPPGRGGGSRPLGGGEGGRGPANGGAGHGWSGPLRAGEGAAALWEAGKGTGGISARCHCYSTLLFSL